MEKRKRGLHLTYIPFKKIISWCRDSYTKISGHKRTWQNVLNNKLSATVMERYRQGLREFTHRRQTKILLGSWREIAGDFSGQLAEITAGKEREWGCGGEVLETGQRKEETEEQRGTGLKTEFQKGLRLGQQKCRTFRAMRELTNKQSSFNFWSSISGKERRGQSKAIMF